MSLLQAALAAVEQGFADGDSEAAFAAADRVIRLGARTPFAFIARACALERAGQYAAALDDLLDAAARRPGQREFKLRALRFALSHGFEDRAAQLASFWLRIEPDSLRQTEFVNALRHLRSPFGYCELHGDVVVGWAVGGASKTVQIEIDGVYGSVECCRPTPELGAVGIGDGFNGFSVKLPAWERVVRMGIDGHALWGGLFVNTHLPAGAPPSRAPARPAAVDIIVPVYQGRKETLACIDSVLSSANASESRLILVNDCSPDQDLIDALRACERRGQLVLINRQINAGFIAAVQTVIHADPRASRDIVLLNADTLVHGDWLDRLQQAAYSDPAIATATPLSNNAELLSHPESHRAGTMPDPDTLAILDGMARSGRARPHPIPTGIGFCMYIRRDALHAHGGFDEAFLVRGYAEENDFCIRASESGWKNVAVPNVFVAHRGEVSFGAEKRWLAAHNVRRLKARHPTHAAEYDRFLAQDSLSPVRRSLQRRSLVALLNHRELTLVVTNMNEIAWRLGHSPEARLLMNDEAVALEFRHVVGLGRIDYVGKRGLAECARDLKLLRFQNVILNAEGPLAFRLACTAGYVACTATDTSGLAMVLPSLPEEHAPMRLLVPAPANAEDFRALLALAKAWQVKGIPHRLIVLGTTLDDEQLVGLPAVHVTGPLEQQQLDRQGSTHLQQAIVARYGISALALHASSCVRDWQAVAVAMALPVYRLPVPEDSAAVVGRVTDNKRLHQHAAGRAGGALPATTLLGMAHSDRDAETVDGATTHPFAGALLDMAGLCITGWARNNDLPAVPVVVELLADGLPVALVRADKMLQARPDLGDGPTRVSGFQCFLRPELLNKIHSVRARIANTPYYLDGELRTSAAAIARGKPHQQASQWSQRELLRGVSYVRNHGGLRLAGIAVDTVRPERTLTVVAEYQGRQIAQTLANAWAAELHDMPGVDAAHGFSLSLPIEFADGKQRVVQIVDEEGRALPGSPIPVCCSGQTIDSWLHSLNIRQADASLLAEVLKMAGRHVPLALDFSAYADWKQRFGSAPVRAVQGKVVVVLGLASTASDRMDATLNSLRHQTHGDWLACVRGKGNSQDERIHIVGERQWKATLNRLLQETDYAAVIEPGDVWHPHTLAHALAALQDDNAQVAYCDCDAADVTQRPWFKPDWCPDTFLAQPLLHHGFVARSAVLAGLVDNDAPSDWPWLAAAAIGNAPASYVHVARPHHTSANPVHPPGPRALSLVQQRFGVHIAGTSEAPRHPLIFAHRISYPEPAWPRATLIVPTRDGIELLKPCIESLLRTDYPGLDICVVDNGSTCKHTLSYLKRLPSKGVRVLSWPYPFNYSAINNFAVNHADSEIIGLINNDVEALDATWLRAMVTQLMRDGVGAVGAKLLWKNRMVQHGGVQPGLHGLAGHVGNNWLDSDPGYCGINQVVRSASAVTAACLLIRKADYEQLGGLNEHAFPVAFNDVDLCLRLRASGKRIVWTPEAVLIHAESASRGADHSPEQRSRLEREKANLQARWGELLFRDPYYNPNLSLDQYSHTSLALPPRHT